jgi:hypothetical protein
VNTAYPESRPAHDAIAKASGDERHQEADDQRDTATKDHPLGSVTISIPSQSLAGMSPTVRGIAIA